MLRLFLQGIEQVLGSGSSTVSQIAYWGGLTFLLFSGLIPLLKQMIELAARKMSLERQWVMTCSYCRRTTMVMDKTCGHCGEPLSLPLYIRLWFHIPKTGSRVPYNTMRWILHTLAATTFVASATMLVITTGGLHPTGELHQLFLGLSSLALG